MLLSKNVIPADLLSDFPVPENWAAAQSAESAAIRTICEPSREIDRAVSPGMAETRESDQGRPSISERDRPFARAPSRRQAIGCGKDGIVNRFLASQEEEKQCRAESAANVESISAAIES